VRRLIYSVMGSLDGFMTDERGDFDWATPDEEVLAFINEQERSVGTYLYGRRMYELMTAWETDPAAAGLSVESGHFAELWQKADKIVLLGHAGRGCHSTHTAQADLPGS